METHHPHHLTHKKKWTEYLLEFFMLFLAVFCGFIAENIREHGVEERREKQYMRSLVYDLQVDTAAIAAELELGNRVYNKIDSFITLLNSEKPDSNNRLLYRLYVQGYRIILASFEDRTSSQLKSSGSMRLIRNNDLSDSLRTYWEIIKTEDEIAARMEFLMDKIADIGVQLFHNKYMGKSDPKTTFNTGWEIDPAAKLISDDKNLLAQLSNRYATRRGMLYRYLKNLQHAREAATGLISFIKKEYDLE